MLCEDNPSERRSACLMISGENQKITVLSEDYPSQLTSSFKYLSVTFLMAAVVKSGQNVEAIHAKAFSHGADDVVIDVQCKRHVTGLPRSFSSTAEFSNWLRRYSLCVSAACN